MSIDTTDGNMIERRFGWVDEPEESARVWGAMPWRDLSLEGEGAGKIALLHQIFPRVVGKPFPVWNQGIGDCVSFGWALALSTLVATQVARGQSSGYPADVATEPIYGGSRVEVGGRRLGPSEDGSIGAWAARWVCDWGVLFRQNYGPEDLSAYQPSRARSWGWSGVPDALEPIAREHPVGTARLIGSYTAARDWIAGVNGPVVVCSNQGFEDRRDSQGFARARGVWPHCMCFVAVDDAASRPGLLCCNSWGPSWISGPTRHDQPPGSFWVDAETADRMLRQGDSHGVSDFRGLGPRTIDWIMY